MSQPKGIPVAPLTGLLDMRSSPDLLPQGALRFRQNFQTVAEGKLRRGCGWTKAFTKSVYNNQDFHDQLLLFGGSVCEPITGEWEFQSARGIRSFWIATQSRIAKLNETTGNYKIIASGLGGGVGTDCSGPRFKAANVGDYVIFTNGHDRPKIHRLEQPPFDDVLIADIPDLETIGLTKAAVTWAWKDVVFLADVEMDGERRGNRFVWGNVKDPTSFDPSKPETIAGFADLNYGERILAGGETTAGTFLMYTTAGIWELTAVNDDRVFAKREAYPGRKADFVGCLKYQNTLLDIGGDHLYMAKDGIYAFNPYRSAPELVTWLHRASSVLYDDIDEAACAAHIGWFHDGEAFWSVKRTSDMACPGITLRVETQWKVADTIDHGFTAATNFRPQPIPTIRDFILDKRICTLEGLTESLEAADLPPPFENEGLPAPFDEPTAAFTPTVIHTHSVYQFGGTLTVSGAGTGPANGTYVWNYSTGRYENSLDWYISTTTNGVQRQWKLYNDVDVLIYTNTAPLGTVEGTWTESNAGDDPKPTVVAGEDVIVSEDFEQLASDADSLCALMGDTTIDDLCQGCEAVSVLIAASSQDLCLKQFGGFYRERCANPCSVGTVAIIPTCVDVSPIIIGTEELTDGTQGEAYSFQMAATGGSGSFIWAVVGGTLPAGLTLSSAGLISGTPTESGSFEISIRASDAVCSVDDADVTLTIEVPVIEEDACGTIPPVELLAYYKCEDVALPVVDSVSAKNLDNIGGHPTFATDTGIIGTGLFTDVVNGFWMGNSDAQWELTGAQGFSLRAWFWYSGNPASVLQTYVGEPNARYALFMDDFPFLGIKFRFTVRGLISFTHHHYANIPGPGWNRVIGIFRPLCGTLLKINNEATDFSPFSIPINLYAGSTRFDLNGQNGGVVTKRGIDEVAVWRGALTEAQMLADWNSGAGKSYPDLPGI